MKFLVITDNANMVETCVSQGIDRIFIDLETEGKAERQASLNAHFSIHTIDDLAEARKVIPRNGRSELLVRINPISERSGDEIDDVVRVGCDHIMLPMFRGIADLASLAGFVGGRVPTTGLFETPQAFARLRQLLAGPHAPQEAHLGLNDLSLSLGLDFLMEPLSGGLVDHFCNESTRAGLPFGFGGVGALGTGLVRAELILSEHVRLGSTSVILSRTFREAAAADPQAFRDLVQDLRTHIAYLREQPATALEANRQRLAEAVSTAVSERSR